MARSTGLHQSERGVALVVALLVLVVVTMLAITLMVSLNVNRKMVGYDVRQAHAMNIAESGVGEAMTRIKNGDIMTTPGNPREVGVVFLESPGSLPGVGADTTALGTSQPVGQWLKYTTATKGPDMLTVSYKTDAARTIVYRYDPARVPPVNTVTGLPIYVVTSTGREGTSRRKIVTEIINKPVIAAAKAALTANQDIRFIGNAVVCGYNHSADTPQTFGENGRAGAKSCVPYETASGNLPGSWTTGGTQNGGAATQAGVPVANVSGGTGFYSGPWDMMQMGQADFFAFMNPPVSSPSTINGLISIDNDGTVQNKSASASFHSVTGEGILYIDGDVTMNAGFTYRGLVYIEGDLKLNGQAWILGGMVVNGKTEVRMNGGATILYSSEAIARASARYGGQFVTLSWRELR